MAEKESTEYSKKSDICKVNELIETIFHFNKEAGGTQFLYKLNFSEIYLSGLLELL